MSTAPRKLSSQLLADVAVIYPDGSCLAPGTGTCTYQLGPDGDAAFTSNPTLLSAFGPFPVSSPQAQAVVEFGVDDLPREVFIYAGAISDAVWSSRGELAFVRKGWIWTGVPGKPVPRSCSECRNLQLHRLTRGSAPSWSPTGTQIVFARGGWLMIGPAPGPFKRLTRGTAPTWSPDGKSIAFFGNGHRLSVVSAQGGRVRHIGNVTGQSVDWQPLPTKAPAPCLMPPGSKVIAQSATAILSESNSQPFAWPYYNDESLMGCLLTSGRERLLSSEGIPLGASPDVTAAAVAGTYAAIATTSSGGTSNATNVSLFDLRNACRLGNIGQPPGCDPTIRDRGGEADSCSLILDPTCKVSIDSLVLGDDAVSAVDATVTNSGCTCIGEEIQASDSTGVHTLDSAIEPDGSPPTLTNLTLTGDTLTWLHNGTPRSAQLKP